MSDAPRIIRDARYAQRTYKVRILDEVGSAVTVDWVDSHDIAVDTLVAMSKSLPVMRVGETWTIERTA